MIKFEITQAHIDAANEWLAVFLKEFNSTSPNKRCYQGASWRRSCNCPTALALLDHLKLNVGQITVTSYRVWDETDEGGAYRSSDRLSRQISRWDSTGKFEPGVYEITPDKE